MAHPLVLIIDADETARDLYGDWFSAHGFQVMSAVGTVGLSPATQGVRVVKNTMGNVPEREINAQHCRTPCSAQPATFYFKG